MDLNDYPTTTQREIPWKWIAIIGGGALLLLVVAIVVIRMVTASETVDLTAIQRQDQETQVETMFENCEDAADQDGCMEEASQDAASLTGDAGYCMDMEGESYTDCVWSVARAELDVEICAELDAETQVACEDSIYLKLAYAASDSDLCEELSDNVQVEGCKTAIDGEVTSETCEDAVHGEDFCLYVRTSERAKSLQDRSLCSDLATEEYVANCREAVLVDDPDFDGLTTSQELNYGSDPYLADSDGDGYTDYEEVEAGYNPVGEGKLE